MYWYIDWYIYIIQVPVLRVSGPPAQWYGPPYLVRATSSSSSSSSRRMKVMKGRQIHSPLPFLVFLRLRPVWVLPVVHGDQTNPAPAPITSWLLRIESQLEVTYNYKLRLQVTASNSHCKMHKRLPTNRLPQDFLYKSVMVHQFIGSSTFFCCWFWEGPFPQKKKCLDVKLCAHLVLQFDHILHL